MKVFTNGCFDVLHKGHLSLLEECALLASESPVAGFSRLGWVIVGINSDESIRRIKGDDKPINNQEDRKYALECLEFVDKVYIFEEDTPRNLIKKINPNLIVKSKSSNSHRQPCSSSRHNSSDFFSFVREKRIEKETEGYEVAYAKHIKGYPS